MRSLSSREDGLSPTLRALARSGAPVAELGEPSPAAIARSPGGVEAGARLDGPGFGGRLERSGLRASPAAPADAGVDPRPAGGVEAGGAAAWPGGGKEGDALGAASGSAAAVSSSAGAPLASAAAGRRADGGNGGGLLWRPPPPLPSRGAPGCPVGLALGGPCGPRGGGRDLAAAGAEGARCAAVGAALVSACPGGLAAARVKSAAACASVPARWSLPSRSAASAARLNRTAASSVSPLRKSTRAVSNARTTSSESPGCGAGNWGSVTVPPRFLECRGCVA
jgi:hypothetical protein